MKQIALVLVFTALAAVAFVVVRKLNENPSQPADAPGSAAPSSGQAPPRPQIPTLDRPDRGETETIVNAQGDEVEISPEIAATLAARAGFDWVAGAQGDLVTPMADRWDFDLSSVDLDADVIVRYEGGEVTRDEFRSAAAQRLVSPLVEALASVERGKALARSRGAEPRLLSPAMREKRFEVWCASAGVDAEMGEILMGSRNKMPGPLARRFYDVAADSILVTMTGATDSGNVTPEFLASLPDGQPQDALGMLLGNMTEALAQLPADGSVPEDEIVNKLFLSIEQLALLRVSATRDDLAVRIWTQFDHPLEPGAVVGVATGELADGTPPWAAGEGVVQVPMGDLWELIESSFLRYKLLDVLEEYLFFEIAAARLAAEGSYASNEADWALWIEEHKVASKTFLGSRLLNLELLGYPSLGHYRACNRLVRGYVMGQGEGWQAPGDMRTFYDRNRFLVEGWRANLTVAFFPAIAPTELGGQPDYDRARSEAEAMRARVAAGEDFDVLTREHSDGLVEAYKQARGQVIGEEFAASMRGGKHEGALNEIDKMFRQSPYSRLIEGGSLTHNAVAELHDGQVSEPWLTPLGYVLVRMDGASFAQLEREYEDMEFQAKFYHREASFSKWASEAVGSTEVELASSN